MDLKRLRVLLVQLLVLACVMLFISGASAKVIAEGTEGTCPWTIDEAGVLTIGAGELTNRPTNVYPGWHAHRDHITSVIVQPGVKTGDKPVALFSGLNQATSIDAKNLDTSSATTLANMFHNCPKLETLDVTGLNTSNVTTLLNTFQNSGSLTSPMKITGLDTWDTSKVTALHSTFWNAKVHSLKGIENWKTDSLTYMNSFMNLASITAPEKLDLSGWDVPKVWNMQYAFRFTTPIHDYSIKNWKLHWNHKDPTWIIHAFHGGMTRLELNKWDNLDLPDAPEPEHIFWYTFSVQPRVLILNPNFKFTVNDGFTFNPPTNDIYTGSWQAVADGTEEEPQGEAFTTDELRTLYTSTVHGPLETYVWQRTQREVSVTKKWEDADNQGNMRPTNVIISLLADGVDTGKTLVLDADNAWAGAFEGLYNYSPAEVEIDYTIKEMPVAPGYQSDITGDATAGFTVTNSYTPVTLTVSGSKSWDDKDNQDGKRPDTITIRLMKNGTELDSKTVTAAEGWAWEFANLPQYEAGKEVVYTIKEDAVSGYTSSIQDYDVTNSYSSVTLTVSGSKTWDDEDNQDGKRPASITIRLIKNGTELDSKTVTATEGWAWEFANLPQYEAGEEVVYTIKEDAVPNYTTNIQGYNVTNSYQAPEQPVDKQVTPSYPTLQVPLEVTKVLKNGNLKGGEFTFQLKDIARKLIVEVQNQADGTVAFPDRTFSKIVSNYVYQVSELKGADAKVTYDDTVYTVKVSTKDVNGKLEASIAVEKNGVPYAGSIVFTNTLKAPSTGDHSFRLLGILLASSLLLLTGAYSLDRKRKKAGNS
ncbi:MAG: Cna B-type domain-containing protein [Clostridiales bacterium]|nr:Cna B-type domain-containing protein [Clostridiales bacterium]